MNINNAGYLSSFTRRSFLYGGALLTFSVIQSCKTPDVVKEEKKQTKMDEKNKHIITPDQRLYVYAPANYESDYNRINRALERLRRANFQIYNEEACYRRNFRFAGTDQDRINDLKSLINLKKDVPKLLLALRGGYGSIRLLPHIDWVNLGNTLKENKSLLVGYSDITAIQLALLAKSGTPYFNGPMFASDFGSPNLTKYTLDSFINCVTNNTYTVSVPDYYVKNISIEGISWGGNLSIISSLVGSDYIPKIDGGILFIEEVGEHTYRLERMLQTLYLAGILQKQKAIVFGVIKNQEKYVDTYDSGYTFSSVLSNLKRVLSIPIITNFPFGHISEKTTFPFGVPCQITTSNQSYKFTFINYPTLNKTNLDLAGILSDNEDSFFDIFKKNNDE